MQNQFLIIRTSHFALVILGLAISQISKAEAGWELKKDSDGIKVYTRPAYNSNLNEFRGETYIPVAPERIIKALKNPQDYSKWMPNVAISRLLNLSGNEQFHYIENTLPWPLDNRDGVFHFVYTHFEKSGVITYKVSIEAVPNYVPKAKGKVRISKSDGFWLLVSSTSGTQVTYQLHADPAGAIPSWLINSTVVDTPFNTLHGLREMLVVGKDQITSNSSQ